MKTVRLSNGETLVDVYQDFCDSVYGDKPAVRSIEDLAAAIADVSPNLRPNECAQVAVSLDWAEGRYWQHCAFVPGSPFKPLAFIDKLTFTFGSNIDAYEWLLQRLATAECCVCVNKQKEIAFIGVRRVHGEPWIVGFDLGESGERIGNLYPVAPLENATIHIY